MSDGGAVVVDLAEGFVCVDRDGKARAVDGPGPPPRIDGTTVGQWITRTGAGHGGERHDDGDEVLVVVSGRVAVVLDRADGPETVSAGPGQAIVVPQGVWHTVEIDEPTHLLFLTPGPAFAVRPAPS